MKNIFLLIIVGFVTLGLMAFSWMNWSDYQTTPEFNYNVDSRFGTTITKENLHKVRSVIDILPKETDWLSHNIQSMKVTVFHDNNETSETGDYVALNEAQIKLLKSADYSDGFSLRATVKGKHKDDDDLEDYEMFYNITVAPEKEAEYTRGRNALMTYLKEGSKEETMIVKQDKLKRGEISFVVSKEGIITDVNLIATSGYESIDKTMVRLVTNIPGTWDPAANFAGQNMEQEFIFTFGRGGC